MSIQALNWALGVQTGSPGTKCLLLALANYADEAGSCFPGQAVLAQVTCQGVRTVQRQLVQLETMGLIRTEQRGRPGGGRTSNRYILQIGAKPANLADNPVDPPEKGTTKPANPDDQTRQSRRPNPPTVAGSKPPLLAEEPPIEPPVVEPPEENAEQSSAGALFDVDPPKPPRRTPDPLNVEAKALGDHWHTLTNGMSNFHQARTVAVKALKAGHPAHEIRQAMSALFDRRIPLTAGALDIELRGGIGTGKPAVKVYRDADRWDQKRLEAGLIKGDDGRWYHPGEANAGVQEGGSGVR